MPSVPARLACQVDPQTLPQPELCFPLSENQTDEFPLDREHPFVGQERARREIAAAFDAPVHRGHCWLVGLPGSGRHTLVQREAQAPNRDFDAAISPGYAQKLALLPDLAVPLSWFPLELPAAELDSYATLVESGLRGLQNDLLAGYVSDEAFARLDCAWEKLRNCSVEAVTRYAREVSARLSERRETIVTRLCGHQAQFQDDLEVSIGRYLWLVPASSCGQDVLSARAEAASLWGQLTISSQGDSAILTPGAMLRTRTGNVVIDGEALPDRPQLWEQIRQVKKTQRLPISFMAGAEGRAVQGEAPVRARIFIAISPEAYLRLAERDPFLDRTLPFKAEFAEDAPLTEPHKREFCAYMVQCARDNGGPGLAADALAALLFYGSQQVEDARRFSLQMGEYAPILQRAQHLAHQRHGSLVNGKDVEQACESFRQRAGLWQEELERYTETDIIHIAHQGSEVGQVNGLTVIEQPEGAFGRPQRITATVFASKDGLVDIERECQTGGKIHSKGTLILSGYLLGCIGGLHVWPLGISICLEQSYESVDGDSASLAEACAALSAIAAIPLDQGIGVTGSIDQLGQVQAVGGLSAKIAGFFRLCNQRGLNGKQGVIIPRANLHDLVLDRPVREALRQGRFQLWAVSTVAEALEILSGLTMGKLRDDRYPKRSIMGKIQQAVDESDR